MSTEDDIAAAEVLLERLSDAVAEMEAIEQLIRDNTQLAAGLDAITGTDPIALPDAEEVRNRVVTLDAAIMSLHLLAARTVFRSWAELTQKELVNCVGYCNSITSLAGSLFAKVEQVSRFISKSVSLVLTIVKIIDNVNLAQKIRDGSFAIRTEVADNFAPSLEDS